VIFGPRLVVLMPPVPLLVPSEYRLLSLVALARFRGLVKRRPPRVTFTNEVPPMNSGLSVSARSSSPSECASLAAGRQSEQLASRFTLRK
jgi:hypothetical protein